MFVDDSRYKNIVDPISQAGQAVSAVVGTIGQIADAKKRRDLETNLQYLDLQQREALEKQLQKTTSVNKRIEILTNAVAQIRAAQSSAVLSSTIQARAKREMTTAIVVVGGAIALLIAIVILKRN